MTSKENEGQITSRNESKETSKLVSESGKQKSILTENSNGSPKKRYFSYQGVILMILMMLVASYMMFPSRKVWQKGWRLIRPIWFILKIYSKILISHHAIFSHYGQGGWSIWRVYYNTFRYTLFLEPIVEILKSQLNIGDWFRHEEWPLDIPGVVEHRELIEEEGDICFRVILSLFVLFFNSIEVILEMPEDVDSWRSKFLTPLTEVLTDYLLVFEVREFH